MKRRIQVLVSAALLLLPLTGRAEDFTGIRGRAALGGQTVEGVKVFAFGTVDDLIGCDPRGTSVPTDLEGVYDLPVPPGTYWVVGYKGEGSCPSPSPGDLFCFYGGNPVVVERGKPTNVGLSMVEVVPDPGEGEKKGITGYVFDEAGEPLAGAVAYFYRDSKGGFRGIPDYFTRTTETGRFRARIGKGTYFVLVRKRMGGGMFGPTEIGDYFGYYPGNPLKYDGESGVFIRVDAVVRLSQLEKFEGFEEVSRGITVRGTIRDGGGNRVAGYYVFAYPGKESRGMPRFISGKSDGEGNFELILFEGGSYTLVARERPGGPAGESPSGSVGIRAEEGKPIEGITITVKGQ